MIESREQRVLATVVEEVLEQFAFMFGERDDKRVTYRPEGDVLHAIMTFNGPCQGWVSLAAPAELCVRMAANVLGQEEEGVSTDTAQDALKEMLNITCGRLTHDLFGDPVVFDLSVPFVNRVPREASTELLGEKESLHWTVEGMPLIADMGMTGTHHVPASP